MCNPSLQTEAQAKATASAFFQIHFDIFYCERTHRLTLTMKNMEFGTDSQFAEYID